MDSVVCKTGRRYLHRADVLGRNLTAWRSGVTDELKTGFDVAAVAGGIGSWFAIIPDVAAILSIIWLTLRIWETETVKRWTRRD